MNLTILGEKEIDSYRKGAQLQIKISVLDAKPLIKNGKVSSDPMKEGSC